MRLMLGEKSARLAHFANFGELALLRRMRWAALHPGPLPIEAEANRNRLRKVLDCFGLGWS